MRTTLDINDALLVEAKREAARTNQTLTGFVEAALRQYLRNGERPAVEPPRVPVFGGGETFPGIDLTSNAAVLDLIEDADRKRGS